MSTGPCGRVVQRIWQGAAAAAATPLCQRQIHVGTLVGMPSKCLITTRNEVMGAAELHRGRSLAGAGKSIACRLMT